MMQKNHEEALHRHRERLQALDERMSDPAILGSPGELRRIGKERSEVAEVLAGLEELARLSKGIDEAQEILATSKDPDLLELARAEMDSSQARAAEVEARVNDPLYPRDPNDSRDVIVEIRAGTGGEEAALFAAELFRMYSRYAQPEGWRGDIVSRRHAGIGGLKEVVSALAGRGVYGRMKYESGVHRVQRVPETEAAGRIHTSAVTLAVLPEAEDVDVQVDEKDLRVDVYRSSGPGVHTTDSAVRITHLPTNTVVTCQDERSQIKNKAKAMKILRSRLLDVKVQEQEKQMALARKSQVSSGDRSA